MIKNQIQTFPSVFVLTDNSKPSERMGRKATDLKVVKAAYGGWVAEIGYEVKRLISYNILTCSLLINTVGVMLLEVGLQRPQGDINEYLLCFTARTSF